MKLAIVVPRFGENVSGGAELLGKWLAERLAATGHNVDVLTTCASDHRMWQNDLPAGVEMHGSLRVVRFPVRERDLGIHGELDRAIISGFSLSPDEELLWLRHGVSSEEMEEELRRHGAGYDAILALPYLFGTTYFAYEACPENFVLIPCLHDESYAQQRFVREMLANGLGLMFNSHAEHVLAQRLAGELAPSGVVGAGVEPRPRRTEAAAGTRLAAGPSILYAGRRELGKNTPLLIEYFTRYKDRRGGDLALVFAGSGDPVPRRSDTVEITPDWDSMYRQATIFCQPGVNESFSIVLLQAWLAGCPAIVHGDCPVTREHCERSNGGLWFRTYAEFEAIVDALLASPELRARLGRNGRAYVEREYSWRAVLDRFHALMRMLLGSRKGKTTVGPESN